MDSLRLFWLVSILTDKYTTPTQAPVSVWMCAASRSAPANNAPPVCPALYSTPDGTPPSDTLHSADRLHSRPRPVLCGGHNGSAARCTTFCIILLHLLKTRHNSCLSCVFTGSCAYSKIVSIRLSGAIRSCTLSVTVVIQSMILSLFMSGLFRHGSRCAVRVSAFVGLT